MGREISRPILNHKRPGRMRIDSVIYLSAKLTHYNFNPRYRLRHA